jgi:CHAT domain-containing protein
VPTVLLSPDGILANVPFGALPGDRPGAYLLEERTVALIPVARLLPRLVAGPTRRAGGAAQALLVGNVSYAFAAGAGDEAAAPGRPAVRGGLGHFRQFRPLPATRGEVVALRDLFEQAHPDGGVRILRGTEATEANLRRLAPRCDLLHFATHGFFAPPEVQTALGGVRRGDGLTTRQDLAGYHPGLLSGIVLAGANAPPRPDRDDGILTALEVADLDLGRVELATLSACETALGEVAGGEGVLGLQRAFQVAGARSVVASLWSVDDERTRRLMERFYTNLWRRQMPRAEALREAQLWLLRGDGGRRAPHAWAAFVLSGDWR